MFPYHVSLYNRFLTLLFNKEEIVKEFGVSLEEVKSSVTIIIGCVMCTLLSEYLLVLLQQCQALLSLRNNIISLSKCWPNFIKLYKLFRYAGRIHFLYDHKTVIFVSSCQNLFLCILLLHSHFKVNLFFTSRYHVLLS